MASELLTLDIEELNEILREKLARIRDLDLTSVWGDVALLLRAAAAECFAGSHDPEGNPWAPLRNPRPGRGTGLRNGKPKQAQILVDKGFLLGSLIGGGGDHIEEISPTLLKWGTNIDYAGYHQWGTNRIPARPFLGLTEEGMEKIGTILLDYCDRELGW